jgi:DegV family protein with EDD domain
VIGTIAVVTDSASYLPGETCRRYGVHVVPLTVVIDGREYQEGVDITADEFYRLADGAASVTTSQPSPGVLAETYKRAAECGATQVVSVHIGAALSGTVQAARAAAALSPIPVTVIDSGQASFAEGLVVLEVIEALQRGAAVAAIPGLAAYASARVDSTFIVKSLDIMRRGGRLSAGEDVPAIPVLRTLAGVVSVAGSAASVEEAVAIMAGHIREAAESSDHGLRVGIGHGAAAPIADALRAHVAVMPGVDEIIDYLVGPSVGAHTGAGNAGAVYIRRASS